MPSADVKETIFSTPRGTFGVRVCGSEDGPLVLCLHGFPDDAATWDGLLVRLADAGFRAVAPYCRGYAPSPRTNPDGSPFGRDLFQVLAHDAIALADALSPGRVVFLVGHDNGAFTVYHALALAPARFARAVTLSAGHPAAVFANSLQSPRQMWRSRYAAYFQIPGSERHAANDDFRYIETLWRRWVAPGWVIPADHLAHVKATLRASWPAPLLHYRPGGFGPKFNGGLWPRIKTPTLYLTGGSDGCVSPDMAAGQEAHFDGSFRSRVVAGAGHFLHRERPELVESEIVRWLTQDG